MGKPDLFKDDEAFLGQDISSTKIEIVWHRPATGDIQTVKIPYSRFP